MTSKPMTMDERIEIAAQRIYDSMSPEMPRSQRTGVNDKFRAAGRRILELSFPELFTDPPEAKIVPIPKPLVPFRNDGMGSAHLNRSGE